MKEGQKRNGKNEQLNYLQLTVHKKLFCLQLPPGMKYRM